MEENRKKQLIAALAGLVDPWLRQKAQEVASTVPADSILRRKDFEALLGAAKGLLEAWAEKLSPTASVAVEKATDFGDFVSGALGSELVSVSQNWMRDFFTESSKRLHEAEDPTAEFEKIKLELEMRQQLVELIQQNQKKESEPGDKEPIWITKRIGTFNRRLEERIKVMKDRRDKKRGGL